MSISGSMQKLNNMELNDLDFENIGSWPVPVKFIACLLVLFLVLGAGYYVLVADELARYDREQEKELKLKKDFEKKIFKASNLEAYRSQLKEMESSFSALLKQLPTETEVPGLLEDITYTGLGSGLNFESIDLQNEVVREFYIELPIRIKVRGGYHEVATFISGVASLPRIVTLHDFTIEPTDNPELLFLDILARTYRYKDQGEEEQ